MYLSGRAPLPAEYRFLALDGLSHDLPADLADRVLLAVDCANERRIAEESTAVDGAAARRRTSTTTTTTPASAAST